MNRINIELLGYQKEWLSKVVEPFISKGYDEQFSRPFHFGISEKLDPKKKLIMIVGQEADRFWKYEDTDKTPEYIQRWCIGYFDKQIFKTSFAEYDQVNHSAFWRFFRMLHEKGFELCWNNVDKLHRYQGKGAINQTETLTVEYEKQLSAQYGEDRKSLLQREIEAVNPSAVVFLTGPSYKVTMCTAFGISDSTLEACTPTKTNSCSEISEALNLGIPAFWTYHPGYLYRNSGYVERVVEQISGYISK